MDELLDEQQLISVVSMRAPYTVALVIKTEIVYWHKKTLE